MKEQWKPLNAIGNNDYPIWLGQEENGQFVLLDERRWTFDLQKRDNRTHPSDLN